MQLSQFRWTPVLSLLTMYGLFSDQDCIILNVSLAYSGSVCPAVSCQCMQGSGTDGDRTATMLLAAFAVVLGVCAVLGGLAVWKVYQQRQVCLATATPGYHAVSSDIVVT